MKKKMKRMGKQQMTYVEPIVIEPKLYGEGLDGKSSGEYLDREELEEERKNKRNMRKYKGTIKFGR